MVLLLTDPENDLKALKMEIEPSPIEVQIEKNETIAQFIDKVLLRLKSEKHKEAVRSMDNPTQQIILAHLFLRYQGDPG